MSKKLREASPVVIHLIPTLDIGGSEILLLDLVKQTRDARYRHVIVSLTEHGVLLRSFLETGVKVYSLSMAETGLSLSVMRRFREIARIEGADIVHAWMYHANLFALISFVFRSKPKLIWSLHASDLDFRRLKFRTRLVIKICALLSGFPAAVVMNSEVTHAYHSGLGYRPKKSPIIYNGINTSRFAPDTCAHSSVIDELKLPPESCLIGFFARWDPLKDHATFFRAARRVAATNPEIYFILAGPNITSENAELVQMIGGIDPNLLKRVKLLGPRLDMPRLSAALSLMVVTSTWGESFCLVAAQAMSSGVPCVVTDVTFLPTLVGDTGIVVARGDDCGVASAIAELCKLSHDERRSLGSRARERIESRFSLDLMVSSYLALYDDVLAEAP